MHALLGYMTSAQRLLLMRARPLWPCLAKHVDSIMPCMRSQMHGICAG